MIIETKNGYAWKEEGRDCMAIVGINATNDNNGNKKYKVFLKNGGVRYAQDCTLPYYFFAKFYRSVSGLYASKNKGLPVGYRFMKVDGRWE